METRSSRTQSLRQAGPEDDGVVLGIDFGCTKMAVAVVQDGDVDVLPNDIGARTTPSVVHVQVEDGPRQADGEQRQTAQTGEAALRLAVSDPDKTIRNVKRVIGRPYSSVCRDPGKPLLGPVKLTGGDEDATWIRLGSLSLSPEEIAGTLLLDVRKFAEAHLNRRDIRKAVIAVPSYFNIAQRQGIIDAARLAGLPEVRLVNETTAAALAFAHDREGPKLVVVVDVGGGGGSVSVVKVDGGGVQVVRTCGKRLPGGDEFDIRMINYLWTAIREEHGKEVEDHRSMEILRSTWEKAKQKLSRIPHVEISTFLPAIDKELKHTIPRSLFEAECSDLFDSILHEISRTLKNAMDCLPKGSCVDHVVLVGGSSRIPHLRAEIDRLLPGKLHKALSPDEAVARGAALLAAGAVRVDKEVLGLETYVTLGDTTFTCKDFLQVEEWHQPPVKQKEYFAVQQASQYGTRAHEEIYEEERCLRGFRFNTSGIILCFGSDQHQMSLKPRYCLDSQSLQQLEAKMERQVNGQKAEMDRAQAKNSLENFLREELAKETVQDAWQKEERQLRDLCKQTLDDISRDPNLSKERADKILSLVSTRREEINKARISAAMEVRRKELREKLATHLAKYLQEEVSPDSAYARADWAADGEWLKGPGQTADLAELQRRLTEARRRKDALEAGRRARLQGVKNGLETTLNSLSLSLQDVQNSSDIVCEKLEKHLHLYTAKSKEMSEWLERHPNAHVTDFEERLNDATEMLKDWNTVCQTHFRSKLELKLNETLQICPKDEKWSLRYTEKFSHIECWLNSSESQSASADALRSKLQDVNKEAAMLNKDLKSMSTDLFRKLSTNLEMYLNSELSKETLCFAEALQFQQYCREVHNWMKKYPNASYNALHDKHLEFSRGARDLKRSQHQYKKMLSKTALGKQIRSIQAKHINEHDIARDLEESLVALSKKYRVSYVENEEAHFDQIQACLKELNEKEVEIKNERNNRLIARSLLEAALDLVTEKGYSKLASPHRHWLQSLPARPAAEFEKRRCRVLADAGVEDGLQMLLPSGETNANGSSKSGLQVKLECIPQTIPTHEASGERAEDMDVETATSGSAQSRDTVLRLMRDLWTRASDVVAPRGWEALPAAGLEPLLAQQLHVLQSLVVALALRTLREAKEAGAMSLLVDTRQDDTRCLASLAVRYVDARGQPVERLLVVREVQIWNDDGAALLQSFSSLCSQADVDWKALLVGVSAEAAGLVGQTFLNHLQALVKDTVPELVNAGVPLEDTVVASCYRRLREDATYRVIGTFFSTIDSLRSLFGAGSPSFAVLRRSCASLQPGDDPWRTYSTSIAFVSAERQGVVEALNDLVDVRPQLYQTASVLAKSLAPSSKGDPFTVCLTAFGKLFQLMGDFFRLVDFPSAFHADRAHLLQEHPFSATEEVAATLLGQIRTTLTFREWSLEWEKNLGAVVSKCVEVTAQAVVRARDQLVHLATALTQRVSSDQLQAQQLNGSQFPSLSAALSSGLSLVVFQQCVPDVGSRVVRALATPLLPPNGPRSAEQLGKAFAQTAGCPADRVGCFAMLATHTPNEDALSEAMRILTLSDSRRLQNAR